ncbi:hypothetical protein GTGU_04367 [Trabulsiella guamensis ATCC 49490]|uniref:CdiI C-terminal domain-containing protein n=1 Tax=Trabulsiella guamensis ATCC 49490 TaxID=1005994 RepID=A0A084ZMK3_9ENTR|nr:hypothetical protein [Trabulsiella guamensis]KFB98697.1 hypothetical protein GTGU_04367 [Trabulsiella guamensis ATCC 49490]
MFGIFPDKNLVYIDGELASPASIVIDEFTEMMNIPLTYWSIDDYKLSWLRSLEYGLATKKHAVLAVSMYLPENVKFIFAWILYFHGDKTFIQNKVLFLDECEGFTATRINDFVQPRSTHTEDGIKISEWTIDFGGVIDFYKTLKQWEESRQ